MTAPSPAPVWRLFLLRSDLARRLGGTFDGPDEPVRRIVTDSRDAQRGDAFLAIRGERADGHDYLPIEGVVGVVERDVPGPRILVPSLVDALARMASSFRDEFAGPVIGVTGSAGKTTTKEFLAAAVGGLGPVAKSAANRNTEYTLPLIWPEVKPGIGAVVVEMAMRGPGQIAHLASFCRPTIGVVTNIGWAHLELLGSREGIAAAKGELFQALPPGGAAIAWAEDEYLGSLIAAAGDRRFVTFGFGGNADLQITRAEPLSWRGTAVEGVAFGEHFETEIAALGRHVALSAGAALLAAIVAGAALADASSRLGRAELPPLRMEVRDVGGATIILDAYNASPPATIAALEAFGAVRITGSKLAVLGPMRELGDESLAAHAEVGVALAEAHRTGVCGLLYVPPGHEAEMDALAAAAARGGCEPDRATGIEEITARLRAMAPGDAALLKASRAFELERAVPER